MDGDDEKLAESEWREAFRQRLIAAQKPRSNADMAELLGITENRYSKYRGSRKSQMPLWLLPKFCKITGVTLEDLILGPKQAAVEAEHKPKKKKPAA
jgi:hypothetical protein